MSGQPRRDNGVPNRPVRSSQPGRSHEGRGQIARGGGPGGNRNVPGRGCVLVLSAADPLPGAAVYCKGSTDLGQQCSGPLFSVPIRLADLLVFRLCYVGAFSRRLACLACCSMVTTAAVALLASWSRGFRLAVA